MSAVEQKNSSKNLAKKSVIPPIIFMSLACVVSVMLWSLTEARISQSPWPTILHLVLIVSFIVFLISLIKILRAKKEMRKKADVAETATISCSDVDKAESKTGTSLETALILRFDIDKVKSRTDSSAYGFDCYQYIFKLVDHKLLDGARLYMGDSRETLSGSENVCVIGVESEHSGRLREISDFVLKNAEFMSVAAYEPTRTGTFSCDGEGLVCDGMYDHTAKAFIPKSGGLNWAKAAFDKISESQNNKAAEHAAQEKRQAAAHVESQKREAEESKKRTSNKAVPSNSEALDIGKPIVRLFFNGSDMYDCQPAPNIELSGFSWERVIVYGPGGVFWQGEALVKDTSCEKIQVVMVTDIAQLQMLSSTHVRAFTLCRG